MKLTRKFTFSASHRLQNPEFSKAENLEMFGKCNHLHGHNYTVEITFQGDINPKTGMLLDINYIKQTIGEVMDTVDHRNLDTDVKWFHTRPSTTENLCQYMWNCFKYGYGNSHSQQLFHKVTIWETDNNKFSYREIPPEWNI